MVRNMGKEHYLSCSVLYGLKGALWVLEKPVRRKLQQSRQQVLGESFNCVDTNETGSRQTVNEEAQKSVTISNGQQITDI